MGPREGIPATVPGEQSPIMIIALGGRSQVTPEVDSPRSLLPVGQARVTVLKDRTSTCGPVPLRVCVRLGPCAWIAPCACIAQCACVMRVRPAEDRQVAPMQTCSALLWGPTHPIDRVLFPGGSAGRPARGLFG